MALIHDLYQTSGFIVGSAFYRSISPMGFKQPAISIIIIAGYAISPVAYLDETVGGIISILNCFSVGIGNNGQIAGFIISIANCVASGIGVADYPV